MYDPELKTMKKNLDSLMHGQVFASRILDFPDNERQKTDEKFKKRLGLFQSSDTERFEIYFKGLVSGEITTAGIGVAIYDSRDRCVFELRKTFLIAGTSRRMDGNVVEIRAFVQCLYAALTFGLKRAEIFCDNKLVNQYLRGEDKPRNKETMTLVDALNLIQRKSGYRVRSSVATRREKVKYAYKLAEKAITTSTTKLPKIDLEKCRICLEHVFKGKMFSINKCLHKYCYSCMNKHVESRLLQGKMPECPHDNCRSKLELESCKKFLSKNLYYIMRSRIEEASIPPTERVYCPFPKCSALLSKTKLKHAARLDPYHKTGMRKCTKCYQLFCINCKVPWHSLSTCSGYLKYFRNKTADEVELKSLATWKRWRQCIDCKHMIELAAGCYHITCRCGYQFCYKCGANLNYMKCGCPAWDLGYILHDAENMY